MLRRTFVLLAGLALAPGTLHATNGYFSHGYGTQSKGMAGAGAALCLSPLAPALNPAALVCVGDRFDVGDGVFNPNRSYTVSGRPSGFPGTFGLAPGTVESGSRYFPIPHLGFSRRLGGRQAVGVAVYGNGGMNTDYAARTFHGASPTGVDLSQLFLAPTWAVSAGRHSFGVSGIADRLRNHMELARRFASWVETEPGWVLAAPRMFSLVCFRHAPPGLSDDAADALNQRILDRVNDSGRAYLSHTKLRGRFVLRLAIGNLRTEERHVAEAWQLLREAAQAG